MRKERGRTFDSCPMQKFGYKRFLSNDLFSPTGQPRNEIGKVDFINDHTGTWNARPRDTYIIPPMIVQSFIKRPRVGHASAYWKP